jgi:hypothetical protein
LGPLLFLLYINDCTENVQGVKLVLFADDTNLLNTGKDEFDLQHKIINIMRELEIWFKKKFVINIEETFAISFYSKQMIVPLRPQIIFKNIGITSQSELRFIGMYITENNKKWGAHAVSLRAKLYKVVYMMKTLKETMSPCMINFFVFSNFES